jgi:hypothetical protein
MQLRFGVLLFAACLLPAQTPEFTGVWKADLAKSKFAGPPPSSELIIVDKQGAILKITSGVTDHHGEYRSSVAYNTTGTESKNEYHGLPMKSRARLDGDALSISSQVAGERPTAISESYKLSSDGKTLEVQSTASMNGKERTQTVVFERQPDAAGDPLRQPEQTAGEHFKNVQILKDLPASRFIDTMHYFSASLGAKCEKCHIEGHFDSDDKKEKKAAREMIKMVASIDQQNFKGHPKVQCYTCHRGAEKPLAAPAFAMPGAETASVAAK